MYSNAMSNRVSTYLLLLPATVILGGILVYPIINGLALSFFEWNFRDIAQSPVWVGLRNYRDIFSDQYFWGSFSVTLRFTFTVVLVEFFAGLSLALILENSIRGIRLFRSLFIVPIMIAPVVVGVIWRFLYNPSYGKFNYLLSLIGVPGVGWLSDPGISLFSVIIADVWQWTPFVFLLFLAGLQSISKDIIEASRIDGASYFRQLFHIKLPIMASVIGITLVLRMIDSLRALVVVFNLTYGGPGVSTELLSLRIYKTAFVSQRLGMASANASMLLLAILILFLILILQRLRGVRN